MKTFEIFGDLAYLVLRRTRPVRFALHAPAFGPANCPRAAVEQHSQRMAIVYSV